MRQRQGQDFASPGGRKGRAVPGECVCGDSCVVPSVTRHGVVAEELIKRKQEAGLLAGPDAGVWLTAAAGGSQTIRFERFTLQASTSGGGIDCFTADGSFTWYITEGSARRDTEGKAVDYLLYGLVEGQRKELDYFWLSGLETLRSASGTPVQRDSHWQPKMLQEIAPEMFQTDPKQRED